MLGKDVNGDGRDDLAVMLCTATPCTNATLAWAVIFPATNGAVASRELPSQPFAALLGDINGDGLLDLLGDSGYAFGTGVDIAGSTTSANGTVVVPFAYPSGVANLAQAKLVHWDTDGKSDILFPSAGSWQVAHANGSGFDVPNSTGVPYVATDTPVVADFDGDGLKDLAFRNSSSFKYRSHVGGGAPDLLTRVTDGLGVVTEFVYAPLSDTATYTPGAAATFPQAILRGTRPIVSKMRRSDGTGVGSALNTVTFQYEDGRLDLNGRGVLGFRKRIATDDAGGYNIKTEEVYKQDFPYIGLTEQVTVKQSSGASIRSMNNTWLAQVEGTANVDQRVHPYLSSQTAQDFEVGGANNGKQLRTVAMSVAAIDTTSGTITDQTTTITEHVDGGGLNAGQVFTNRVQIPAGSLLNDTTQWCLGRAQRVDEAASHSATYGTPQTRRTDFGWDAAKCRPTSITRFPTDAGLTVQTVLGYDLSGNVQTETVAPAGMPQRLTTLDFGTDGLRLRSVTNAENHATQQTWDFASDQMKTLTEPNGRVSSRDYDSFARPTLLTHFDGTRTKIEYLDCTAAGGCPLTSHRLVVKTSEQDATAAHNVIRDDWSYLDRFERSTVDRRRLINSSYQRIDREFDALGRLQKESAPCWWGSCTYYWTTRTFDLAGRVKSISRPKSDSDATLATASVDHLGLVTAATDPLGRVKRTTRNARGEIVRVQDAYGTVDAATADYFPDAFGNLKRVVMPDGKEMLTDYNIAGHPLQSTDPDTGITVHEYYATGDLKHSRTANTAAANPGNPSAWTVEWTYDRLSRPLTRIDVAENATTTWTWDLESASCDEGTTGGKGKGQLSSVSLVVAAVSQYSARNCYDELGRIKARQVTPSGAGSFANATNYGFKWSYYTDSGLLDTLTYPQVSGQTNGFRVTVKHGYNAGRLAKLTGPSAYDDYWHLDGVAPSGQITANGFSYCDVPGCGNWEQFTSRPVDLVTGLPKQINSSAYAMGSDGGLTQQAVQYSWDVIGNLKSRTGAVPPGFYTTLTENYEFDDLDRLKVVRDGSNAIKQQLTYGPAGNILTKSDVGGAGNFSYDDPAHPHAVTCAGTNRYEYDANGNMVRRAGQCSPATTGQLVTWYSYNLPKRLEWSNQNTLHFSDLKYGPDRDRYFQTAARPSENWTETDLYIDGLFEKRVTVVGSSTHTYYVHHILANGQLVAIATSSPAMPTYAYPQPVIVDQLDSVVDVGLDQNSTQDFDPWGRRRNPASWSGSPDSPWIAEVSARRGFTGHEHLDAVDLIHMNGRVYHPLLGRFLSPDPVIPDLYDTQALNPYSYVLNNPLKYTDPSGFEPEEGCNFTCFWLGLINSGNESDQRQIEEERAASAGLRNDQIHANNPAQTMRMDSAATSPVVRNGASPHGRQDPLVEHVIMGETGPIVATMRQSAADAYDDVNKRAGEVLLTAADIATSMPGPAAVVKTGAKVLARKAGQEVLERAAAKSVKALPALDRTGKVHGALPKAEDLARYSRDELKQLQNDLRQSVQERIRKTSELGPDRAHGQRQGAEQQLIHQIEKVLSGS